MDTIKSIDAIIIPRIGLIYSGIRISGDMAYNCISTAEYHE